MTTNHHNNTIKCPRCKKKMMKRDIIRIKDLGICIANSYTCECGAGLIPTLKKGKDYEFKW